MYNCKLYSTVKIGDEEFNASVRCASIYNFVMHLRSGTCTTAMNFERDPGDLRQRRKTLGYSRVLSNDNIN